jgi:hypothetical protein
MKNHNPRQIEVSSKLITMINALPRISERIFPTTDQNTATRYYNLRKKVARNTVNPRIMKITLVTFRHFDAT